MKSSVDDRAGVDDLARTELEEEDDSLLVPNDVQLVLTEEERRLFDVLVKACKSDVSVRVAGGWVRDKILQSKSVADSVSRDNSITDVDIALGGMNGVDFATLVKEYLEQHDDDNNDTGSVKKERHKIGVISANPSQSKHLETATMTVFGLDVDFVNLRAEEVYADDDSRIPTATNQYGTPRQDALRRDFTVNALFYNLRTRRVEDWTGRGLTHLLEERLLQTPLADPAVTFVDDPLRVLRAVRFAVRYGFTLHPDVRTAASSPDPVQQALLHKVSRERVGKELEGMLSGRDARPAQALRLLHDLRLCQPVFYFPGCDHRPPAGPQYRLEPPTDDATLRKLWDQAANHLDVLSQAVLPTFQRHLNTDAHNDNNKTVSCYIDSRMLHIATFLLPFFHLKYIDTKKKKDLPVVQWMLREGIKFKNADITTIGNYVRHVSTLRSFLTTSKHNPDINNNNNTDTAYRTKVGLLLRKLKEQWVTCLLLATVVELHDVRRKRHETTPSSQPQQQQREKHDVLGACTSFYTHVTGTLRLHDCWKWKPLLNGGQIGARLELPRGPLVGVYLDEHIKFMLCHHLLDDMSVEDCETHLLQTKKRRQSEGMDDTFVQELLVSKGISNKKKK